MVLAFVARRTKWVLLRFWFCFSLTKNRFLIFCLGTPNVSGFHGCSLFRIYILLNFWNFLLSQTNIFILFYLFFWPFVFRLYRVEVFQWEWRFSGKYFKSNDENTLHCFISTVYYASVMLSIHCVCVCDWTLEGNCCCPCHCLRLKSTGTLTIHGCLLFFFFFLNFQFLR